MIHIYHEGVSMYCWSIRTWHIDTHISWRDEHVLLVNQNMTHWYTYIMKGWACIADQSEHDTLIHIYHEGVSLYCWSIRTRHIDTHISWRGELVLLVNQNMTHAFRKFYVDNYFIANFFWWYILIWYFWCM